MPLACKTFSSRELFRPPRTKPRTHQCLARPRDAIFFTSHQQFWSGLAVALSGSTAPPINLTDWLRPFLPEKISPGRDSNPGTLILKMMFSDRTLSSKSFSGKAPKSLSTESFRSSTWRETNAGPTLRRPTDRHVTHFDSSSINDWWKQSHALKYVDYWLFALCLIKRDCHCNPAWVTKVMECWEMRFISSFYSLLVILASR